MLGLPARVDISGASAATDRLTVDALAGDDVIDASGLAASAIALTASGGDNDDVILRNGRRAALAEPARPC